MVVHKSVSVRLSEELRGYVESLGENFTEGLVKVIREHMRKSFDVDVESGLEFLMSFAKVIEFKEVEAPDL